ncbi:hypothetical protein [Phaeobacter inhibens]|uniref:hypothetical protein n=1 Tax=Phaeobacter inhibens TaxID=221822 RepID=UPI00097175C3|nr:hypothetical protein [Phaeobacter inhibens]APX17816.1 hypothetical protein BWR17_18165 [Phaeobacter inhibens]UWR43668.1 hypothetical protein K4F86_09815 [Phaeobacter inhibens]UWR50807.1 hypothetical protein K4F87_08700 [Phaeobacter inhibens]UWR67087.1 hypothetical protein K4K95_09925 [Phaeobacter inhibens]
MSIIPSRFLAHVTQAGVAMPPVPADHTRHIATIQTSNDAASGVILTCEIDAGGETYKVTPAQTITEGDARASMVGPGTLLAGDVLRFVASDDAALDVWVSYHDRPVPEAVPA